MLRAKWRNTCLAVILVPTVVLFLFQRLQAVDCFQFPNNVGLNRLENRRNAISSLTHFAAMVILQKDANALSLPYINQQQDRRQKEVREVAFISHCPFASKTDHSCCFTLTSREVVPG